MIVYALSELANRRQEQSIDANGNKSLEREAQDLRELAQLIRQSKVTLSP